MLIRFYGTKDSIDSWMKILESENMEIYHEPRTNDEGRIFFVARLSPQERENLQNKYWYAVETEKALPWNWRISFKEVTN